MKKILILMPIIFSLIIISCSNDDNSKADLRWSNKADSPVKDIKWMNGSTMDQIWDGEYANESQTSYKGINALIGQGECLDQTGQTADISIDTTNSEGIITSSSSTLTAVVQENATATLVISSIAKKK
ncbi:MAG TPA: hypothetical protein P5554_13015 [Spirochaetota bacterium]|nr:hypothetical protein [Spirochaetota bacterium]